MFYSILILFIKENQHQGMKLVNPKQLPYEVLLNKLISVDANDQFIMAVDKWQAHSNDYLTSKNALPHRAFSIFLFNQKNQLLFQKRSQEKKTFPLCWTNTCCSHPNMIKLSNGEEAQEPIRASLHRALKRQFKMQLNNPFYYMNTIIYKQTGFNGQQFGEYEVDYVYLNKTHSRQIKFELVPQQIAQIKWVNKDELPHFMKDVIKKGGYFSPWFGKMEESGLLLKWWKMIEQDNLKDQEKEGQNMVLNMV